MESMRIGVIGTGNMGTAMGSNLINKGYDKLAIYDIRPEAMIPLKKRGAKVAGSSREVGEKSDVIITSLPSFPNVRAAVLGKDGLIESINGKTLIEISTIDPGTMIEVAQEIKKKGGSSIEAAAGGIPPKAAKGDMMVFVAGDRSVVREHEKLLKTIGKRLVYFGDYGNAKVAKLANNTLTIINGMIASEISNWLVHRNLDLKAFRTAVSDTNAQSRRLDETLVNIINKEKVRGKIFNLKKDMGLALMTASEDGVVMPITSLSAQILQSAISLGYSSRGIYKVFDTLSEGKN
jgi:2-hydroxy-3-oxopropionate reductase